MPRAPRSGERYTDVPTEPGAGERGAPSIKERVDATVDGVTVYDSELAFRLRHPANVRVDNAVIYNVDFAYRLEDGLDGARVYHNTFGGGIAQSVFTDAGGDPVGLVVKNNLVFTDALVAPLADDASNMAADAGVFVDAAGHDYYLADGAAPIDAAEPLPEVAVDRNGVARPVGDAADVGAYEWSDEPPGTTSSTSDSGETTDPTATDTDPDPTASGTDSGTDSTTGGSSESATTGVDSMASDSDTLPTSAGPATESDSDSGGDGSGCACSNAPSHGPRGFGALALIFIITVHRRRRRV